DFLQNKRQAAITDAQEFERLRQQGAQIRNETVARLPELLEQLEQNCTQNGIQVHWAQTPAQANEIVAQIAARNQANTIVKGKSMASEEIGLNTYMAQRNVDCIETDMGEFIVQIANETPSHIIMPAIHKNKAQIAQLLHEHIAFQGDSNDV
ncbi:MAG: (Fe-S)-binding protein, partial [Phototrophicales bacterium]